MTRYAIDTAAAWRLVRDPRPLRPDVTLVGAAALKSQVLAEVYRTIRAEGLSVAETRALMNRLAELKVRLLGDRVTREVGVRVAGEMGWDDIGPAETLAVATLQADALVTTDALLEAAAAGRIRLADYDELVA